MSHHNALELYDYQQAILDKLRTGFIDGHDAQMLVAPTGAGKTEMAMELLDATAKKGNRAAMVLDRIVLCNQTSERLEKYGIDHGVMQSGHWRFRPYEPIQVCSAQTLERRGSFPDLKLLVVDEAHQMRRQTLEFIRNNPGVKVVGLSATPFTKGLGRYYTNIVSAISTRELVERGRLAPLRVFIAKEIDMSGAKKVAGEWSGKDAQARGMAITGDVVSEWVKKTHEVFGGPRKTVVFASGVAHAEDLARKFAEAGYNFVSLSYRDDDEFKAEAIKDFARPDTSIHGLIATDILTKGFDVPDVMIGVSARPFSKSFASHVQQMGRVMRASPGKEFALWLCHSGNYLRFLEDWEDVYANGVSGIDESREKPRREKTDAEKEAAKCPKCGRVWPHGSDTCPSCGFVRLRRSDVIAIPGELRELTASGKAPIDKRARQQFYSQLIAIANEKGYSDGWTAHKYRERFGVWPRGVEHVEAPVSAEVARWVKSRQIAWAKSRRAA
jgi:DNA repair protein RadD